MTLCRLECFWDPPSTQAFPHNHDGGCNSSTLVIVSWARLDLVYLAFFFHLQPDVVAYLCLLSFYKRHL